MILDVRIAPLLKVELLLKRKGVKKEQLGFAQQDKRQEQYN